MTHCTTATDVASPVAIAGNATLTTDSSMYAITEARIVAANTQRFCAARQSDPAGVARIAASSHGRALGLITAWPLRRRARSDSILDCLISLGPEIDDHRRRNRRLPQALRHHDADHVLL